MQTVHNDMIKDWDESVKITNLLLSAFTEIHISYFYSKPAKMS